MSKTKRLLIQLENLASLSRTVNLNYFYKLRPKEKKLLDKRVHQLHDEVFEEIDCLECAACCKSLGPRITDKDLQRLAKHFRQREVDFMEQYLRLDEDGDYVFKQMPCPFLMDDNYCSVYEYRPKACREYPHTDRVNFYQIHKLSIKNSETCPAVYEILERLREEL